MHYTRAVHGERVVSFNSLDGGGGGLKPSPRKYIRGLWCVELQRYVGTMVFPWWSDGPRGRGTGAHTYVYFHDDVGARCNDFYSGADTQQQGVGLNFAANSSSSRRWWFNGWRDMACGVLEAADAIHVELNMQRRLEVPLVVEIASKLRGKQHK